ncbi:hypothetical protein, partial [Methylomagnum sp.]
MRLSRQLEPLCPIQVHGRGAASHGHCGGAGAGRQQGQAAEGGEAEQGVALRAFSFWVYGVHVGRLGFENRV